MPQLKRWQLEPGIRFSLEKYYVDLVTAEGQYFIGYSARLSLGNVNFDYAATLHDPALSGLVTGPVLSTHNAPVADDSGLRWHNPELGFDGRWHPLAAAETLVLHETKDGVVEWSCQQPAARVHLKTGTGKSYDGLGYAEFLNLTIPPWQLGLQTLYWGRFVSENHAVVWIEWQGEHPLTVLICDGQKIADASISDNEVMCGDFELTLERGATVPVGSIAEKLVTKIPPTLRVSPVEFLSGREQKFLSRGHLRFVNGTEDSGWVIHERVSW